ncbi:MAG TPA: hypothetical protein VF102_05825 [Gemmatimonadaceae bacterium]
MGGFDSHTFPPRRLGWLAFALAGLLLGAPNVSAQRADSIRVGPTAPVARDTALSARDSLRRPPISSKRALLESLAVPGWGQASLHRSTAGGLFAAIEVTSIAMLIQSKKELNAARELARDSVFSDSLQTIVANPYAGRIPARKQAVEDWTFLLIFTHLISAADAFVAAQLWDVPVEVRGQSDAKNARISVTVPF